MKIKATKKQVSKFIIQIILVALAGLVGGVTFKSFFASMDPPIVPTGMSGFALLVSIWLSYIGVNISTSIIYLVLNVVLFACALKFFGWKFLVLSGVGLGTYVLGMEFGVIEAIASNTSEPLLYCLVGSIISGAAVGVAMRMGGSTGGSDVFGALVNRAAPKIKTGYAILFFNIVVLILSIVTKGLDTGLYALINSILSSIVTDMVLDKSKKIVAFNIICNKPDEVANAIMKHYGRGVTRVDGTGMFTHNDKAVLLCLVPYDQSYKMREFVLKIDSSAFVYSTPVTETIGENNLLTRPLKSKTQALDEITQTGDVNTNIQPAQNATMSNLNLNEVEVVPSTTKKVNLTKDKRVSQKNKTATKKSSSKAAPKTANAKEKPDTAKTQTKTKKTTTTRKNPTKTEQK